MKKLLSIFILVLVINLVAAQVYKTVNVNTAGTLTTLLTATEKTTVTNLTLTGNIDARDVKCIRDELTVLAYFDLSNANIIAYNGNAGTSFGNMTSNYPDNELPEGSFFFCCDTGKSTLMKILIPNSITSIGNYSLNGCKGIAEVLIPKLVTTIKPDAFFNCSNLKIIRCLNDNPPAIDSRSFKGITPTSIYVPKGSLETYKSAVGWNAYASIIFEDITSGIDELKNENNKISIFPNPIKSEFKIDFEGGSTFEILNLRGQVVYSGNLNKSPIVQASDFPAGTYLIKCKTDKSFEYRKIINR